MTEFARFAASLRRPLIQPNDADYDETRKLYQPVGLRVPKVAAER